MGAAGLRERGRGGLGKHPKRRAFVAGWRHLTLLLIFILNSVSPSDPAVNRPLRKNSPWFPSPTGEYRSGSISGTAVWL